MWAVFGFLAAGCVFSTFGAVAPGLSWWSRAGEALVAIACLVGVHHLFPGPLAFALLCQALFVFGAALVLRHEISRQPVPSRPTCESCEQRFGAQLFLAGTDTFWVCDSCTAEPVEGRPLLRVDERSWAFLRASAP